MMGFWHVLMGIDNSGGGVTAPIAAGIELTADVSDHSTSGQVYKHHVTAAVRKDSPMRAEE